MIRCGLWPGWLDHHAAIPATCLSTWPTGGATTVVRPVRGRSGGEDSAFFAGFLAAGGKIAFAPLAVVHETVPSDRARLAWLLLRRYRMGQTHASLIAQGRPRAGRIRAAGVAVAKALACGGLAVVGAARPAWRNRQLMRAALHVGAARLLGAHGRSKFMERRRIGRIPNPVRDPREADGTRTHAL